MGQLRVQNNGDKSVKPCGALHERVPTHDETGKPVSDFIMLIPGLKESSSLRIRDIVSGLQIELDRHQDVIFADLNVSRGVLWVSVRAVPGIIPTIAGAIQARLPEALIVGAPGTAP